MLSLLQFCVPPLSSRNVHRCTDYHFASASWGNLVGCVKVNLVWYCLTLQPHFIELIILLFLQRPLILGRPPSENSKMFFSFVTRSQDSCCLFMWVGWYRRLAEFLSALLSEMEMEPRKRYWLRDPSRGSHPEYFLILSFQALLLVSKRAIQCYVGIICCRRYWISNSWIFPCR